MPIAITIIKDEHRALASVLKGLQHLAAGIRDQQHAPDFPLMRAMLSYIVEFPDKLHHPKEDAYLFPALRERAPQSAATLDLLQKEHDQGPALIGAVVAALAGYEKTPTAFDAFGRALDSYADYQWAHMKLEENVVLPMAEKSLSPEDWTRIDAAFKSNNDPLVGVGRQQEFRELFRQVVNLMPAPYGLGPER